MNVISYDRAYSLYPYATLERRTGLTLPSPHPGATSLIAQYTARGWSFITDAQTLHDPKTCTSSWSTTKHLPRSFGSRPRWIADRHSWIVHLPLDGVTVPAGMFCDPCYASTWQLSGRCDDLKRKSEHQGRPPVPVMNCRPGVQFQLVKSGGFSNVYVGVGGKVKRIMYYVSHLAGQLHALAGLAAPANDRL